MAGLAGCATPTTDRPVVDAAAMSAEGQKQAALVIEGRQREEDRVLRVATSLMTANKDLCPVKRREVEVVTATADDYQGSLKDAARLSLGLSEQPKVVSVLKGGPADLAGLQAGDELVSVGDTAIAAGPKAGPLARKALTDGMQSGAGPVAIHYRRNGEERVATVLPVEVCGYDVRVADSEELNAAADGQSIVITRAMLRFAASDDELALILAHELAHNTERHLAAQAHNANAGMAAGAVADVLLAFGGGGTNGAFMRAGRAAGRQFESAEFEAEADYVGMYYLARAGYRVDQVGAFWRRMAVEQPRQIFIATSHPASTQRYLAIEKTAQEIQAKQAAGEPLLPKRKAKA